MDRLVEGIMGTSGQPKGEIGCGHSMDEHDVLQHVSSMAARLMSPKNAPREAPRVTHTTLHACLGQPLLPPAAPWRLLRNEKSPYIYAGNACFLFFLLR